jgi:hypothetical protein
MFYRSKTQLKAQLEESLRIALEFATLGGREAEPAAHSDAPREPQARVFLFAKVSPPCPHGPAPAARCDAPGGDVVEHRAVGRAGSLVGTRARVRRSRRGGTAKARPQPCTWAGDERA